MNTTKRQELIEIVRVLIRRYIFNRNQARREARKSTAHSAWLRGIARGFLVSAKIVGVRIKWLREED